MKQATTILLLLLLGCSKEDILYTKLAKGGVKGKPKTDTLVIPPPTDTTTPPTTTPIDTTVTTFPSSYELWTPTPRAQGGEGSCVAFSGCYLMSIKTYYEKGDTIMFSPEFVYNQTKFGDCGSGTSGTTVFDLFKTKGVCKWSTMPYSAGDCSLQPNTAQLSEALNYRIQSYTWLYLSDFKAIKQALLSKKGIYINVTPDNSFMTASFGFIWKEFTGEKTAGHSLVIIGYDDSKNAYKVINSWGTSWGELGYSWIDYGFLPYTGNGVGYYLN